MRPFEDLKATREKGLGIYDRPYASCGFWLQERTPEQLRGEDGEWHVEQAVEPKVIEVNNDSSATP